MRLAGLLLAEASLAVLWVGEAASGAHMVTKQQRRRALRGIGRRDIALLEGRWHEQQATGDVSPMMSPPDGAASSSSVQLELAEEL
jgi:hypothetical protein